MAYQYKSVDQNGKVQTYQSLSKIERQTLVNLLDQYEAFIQANSHNLPPTWNQHDIDIFKGMIKLNGPAGHRSPNLPDHHIGLGIDPTVDQYKKANRAIKKMQKHYKGVSGIVLLNISGVMRNNDSALQRQRMNDQRRELEEWVIENVEDLRDEIIANPKVFAGIISRTSSTAADIAWRNRITDIIAPRTGVPKKDKDGKEIVGGDLFA